MSKQEVNRLFCNAKITFCTAVFFLGIFAGAVFAGDFELDMEGETATIPKGNTVERKIYGIPNGIPGVIKLKLKWHALNELPAYNLLVIKLKHGNFVIKTVNCYSIHSNKTPKCDFTVAVSQSEADRQGDWKLVIKNNSAYEVIGFNTEKGNDTNPLVPDFKSSYSANCPGAVDLDLEGTTLTLLKGSTQYRKLYGIKKAEGILRLKAKWHPVSHLPVFNKIAIQLIKPNGETAKSGEYYSIHAPQNKNPKFDITYQITSSDAAYPGNWRLKVTNNSNFEIKGFNIEKEISENNSTVPDFFSSYEIKCGF